jgi:REP element-mobilizing transposase RayT
MAFNSDIHHRRSIRLKNYDYSQKGTYFITICANNKDCFFGEIVEGEMELNDAGKMIYKEWQELTVRFHNIQLDKFVIMPNHIHGIIIVGATLVVAQNTSITQNQTIVVTQNAPNQNTPNQNWAGTRPDPTSSKQILGNIIGTFKSITTHKYIDNVKNQNWQSFNKKLWQRNYYEHIIRNDLEMEKIRKYIQNNPLSWITDSNHR